MGNLEVAAVFMVMLNVLMWFASLGIVAAGGVEDVCYHTEGSIIEQSTAAGNNYTIAKNNVMDDLPGTEGTIQPSSTGGWTDIFTNIFAWITAPAKGLKYIWAIVAAPFNILSCMGLPMEFTAGIGIFWYITSLMALLAFLWGR